MGSWGRDKTALDKARERLTLGDSLLPGDGRLVVAYIEQLEMQIRQLTVDDRDVQWDNGSDTNGK